MAVSPGRRAARAKELLLHALALGTALWAIILLDSCSLSTTGRLTGAFKGADFAQFYTLGAVAADRQYEALVSWTVFRGEMAHHLPTSGGANYPPIYGPQVALAFMPLSRLPFVWAYAVWAAATLALTLGSVAYLVRLTKAVRQYELQAFAATLACPALVITVFVGQISAVALAALALSAWALARRSRVLAGVALGVLGYKVTLFAPALAICLLAAEWVLAATAVGTAVAQMAIAIPSTGHLPVLGFLQNLWAFAWQPDVLAKHQSMASLRTLLVMVLPAAIANAIYPVTALAVVVLTARAWRRATSALDRVGLLGVGAALATPHLYLYDLLTILPAFVCSSEWLLDPNRQPSRLLRTATYSAFLSPLLTFGGLTQYAPVVAVALTAFWIALSLTVYERGESAAKSGRRSQEREP